MVDIEEPNCEQQGGKEKKRRRGKWSERKEKTMQLSLLLCCDGTMKKDKRKYTVECIHHDATEERTPYGGKT